MINQNKPSNELINVIWTKYILCDGGIHSRVRTDTAFYI